MKKINELTEKEIRNLTGEEIEQMGFALQKQRQESS